MIARAYAFAALLAIINGDRCAGPMNSELIVVNTLAVMGARGEVEGQTDRRTGRLQHSRLPSIYTRQ